jgi:ribosomal protein S20
MIDDNLINKKLKKDLDIIQTRIRNIIRIFENGLNIYNNGQDSLENLLSYISKELDKESKQIVIKYNEIVSYREDLLLKFKDFLNMLEEIKFHFFNDLEKGEFNNLNNVLYYIQSFKFLLELFKKKFNEELDK